VKLDLPSISQVHTRGQDSLPYPESFHRPSYIPGERLPSLASLPPGQAYSPGTSSPRVSSIASSHGSHADSQSSFTSAPSSLGPKTPSPTFPVNAITGPATSIATYDAMNQGQPDMYYQHMSAPQPHTPQTVTSGAMSHYAQQQPHLLHPGPSQYGHPPPSYNGYGYTNGLTSPPAAAPVSNQMGGPQPNVLPLPGGNAQGGVQHTYAGYDTTGQVSPAGVKPRVTATLWEDEGSLCFQVEARGICVARREDNHMINGTKLLNVAGMTRGRRDGILKSEKVRHVVKIGPMHLKGVWIPYDRALEFANKEKITEMLYPLFVHNIGTLLYHPTNQSRTSQVMAAADRRKLDQQGQMRNPPPGLPSMPQQGTPHQHHQPPPQQSPMGLSAPQPPLLHNNAPRPSLDRAHTFPTPPTSGSMPNMGSSDHFNWQAQGMNGPQGKYSMPLSHASSNTRSTPMTPATTPPGTNVQSMQPYPGGGHSYDGSRQIYSAPSSQQSPYQSAAAPPQDRMYGQNGSYPKTEMGPPSNRPSVSGPSGDQQDNKATNGVLPSEQGSQPHNGEEEGDHEHGQEYTHDSAAYDAQRNSYNYTAPGVGALAPENNVPADMNGSPTHHPSSGRATPRTTASQQPYYPQHSGYNTPPRVQQSSSTLYNVMSNDRAPTNGAAGNDVYAPQGDMTQPMANGYAAPLLNGNNGSMKRGRDEEDEIPRPGSGGPGSMGSMDLKRRKTMMETSVPAPAYDAMGQNRPASAVTASRRR
jgi:protein SOK2